MNKLGYMNKNKDEVFKLGEMLLNNNMTAEFKELCSLLGISEWSINGRLIFKDGNML